MLFRSTHTQRLNRLSISAPILGALSLAIGCASAEAKPQASPAEKPRTVPLVRVALQPVNRHLVLTGTLRGAREATVASDTNGKVVGTFAERGDLIGAGKPIVRLDATTAALNRAEATAMAESARVEEAQAKADCDRADYLFNARAISASEHDRLIASCSAHAWSSKAAKVREQVAQKNIGDATVRAPFSGVVSERLVTLGEYVRAGSSVAIVVDLDPLKLELTVPESSVGAVYEGQRVEFGVASYPTEHFEGTIRHLGAMLDPQNRSLIVEATVPNPKARLRPGMFATARVVVGQESHPVVPASALVGSERSRRAFVVRNRRLEERVVLVGDARDDRIAVISGLSDGDWIAQSPNAETRDGTLVQ